MDYQWSDFGVNRPAHSWEPALARFMTTIVRLRARNHPNWTEVGVARDIIPSMSIELVTQVSFKSVQPIFCYSFWSAFWPAFRFFIFFHRTLCVGLRMYFLSFHFVHHTCLFDISFISNCISMKLTPEFYLCMPYKATNLQLQTTKCKKFTVPFTLHVGICHNLCRDWINCMKLYTHILHIYLHLWEKFKENVTTNLSRRGSSILPISITLIQYLC